MRMNRRFNRWYLYYGIAAIGLIVVLTWAAEKLG